MYSGGTRYGCCAIEPFPDRQSGALWQVAVSRESMRKDGDESWLRFWKGRKRVSHLFGGDRRGTVYVLWLAILARDIAVLMLGMKEWLNGFGQHCLVAAYYGGFSV
jgi:hypothetical protein